MNRKIYRLWNSREKRWAHFDDQFEVVGEFDRPWSWIISESEYYLHIDEDFGLIPTEHFGLQESITGNLIFEGDIIELNPSDLSKQIVVGEVIFNTDQTLGNFEWGLWTDRGWCPTDFLGKVTLLGNIFENPELAPWIKKE